MNRKYQLGVGLIFSVLFLLFQNFTPISFGQIKDSTPAQEIEVPYYLRDYSYNGEEHILNRVANKVHRKKKSDKTKSAGGSKAIQKGVEYRFDPLKRKAWSFNYTGDFNAEMSYYTLENNVKVNIDKNLDNNLHLRLKHESKDKSSTIHIGKDW